MRACPRITLAACALLAACSITSDLQSDKGKALTGHPLFTSGEAFVLDRDPTFLRPG